MSAHPNTLDRIPVDSLVIGRKLQTASAEMVRTSTEVAARMIEADYGDAGVAISALRPTFDHFTPLDYIDRKLAHPILGAWSVAKLAGEINDDLKARYGDGETGGLLSFSTMHLGDADYEGASSSCKLKIGLDIASADEQRFLNERTEAIKLVLDLAGISVADPLRDEWTDDDVPGLWVPIANITAPDPDTAEEAAEQFVAKVNELKPATMPVDMYEAKAHAMTIDMPPKKIQELDGRS